jgi:predicted ribosomally synthesized peptide with nif11-like leader
MSQEQLKAFLDAVKHDQALRDRLKGQTDPEVMVQIAKESGFLITAKSLKQVDLSDQELAAITGGMSLIENLPVVGDIKRIVDQLGLVGTGW